MVRNSTSSKVKKITKAQRDDLMIENFIGLQKAMTNLSIRFENLSDNLSRLLGVLELSAKSYLVKDGHNHKDSSDLAKQIDYLIDQNKAIAEGLLLIDDTIRKKSSHDDTFEKEKSSQSNVGRALPSTI